MDLDIKMKLCVFQGTFNPIHKAHLRIAKYALENFALEKILFIPAHNPPHKSILKDSPQSRYEMVKLAIQNQVGFEISDIEYKKTDKSYTYLTIKELYKTYKIEDKIKFIIGTDAFEKIETWYESDKLKELVEFIIFSRENNFNSEKFEYLKQKGYNYTIQNLSFSDISSTELRKKIKNNEDVSEYLTKEVKEFIDKNGLYKD